MAKNLLIGEKLRSARLSNRLTLAQVGKTLGVGHGSVAKWERDENNPTLEHLINLAELFDTPIHMLIAENLSAIAAMQHEIEAMVDYVKASPPADPDNPVLIAGAVSYTHLTLPTNRARGGFLP